MYGADLEKLINIQNKRLNEPSLNEAVLQLSKLVNVADKFIWKSRILL